MAGPDFRVQGGEQLEALALRLKSLDNGKVLRKQLTKRLGAAAKPLIPEIRAAVKATPSKSNGSLRRNIARSVQQKTSLSGHSVGVRLRVDGTRMPAGQGSLPKMMEGVVPWRHPSWGNRNAWRVNAPHPYFWRTITPRINGMRHEVEEVLNDITKQIEH